MLVGVISDTHGLLRPEAVEALRGSDLIIHGGDIGALEVIDGLSSIAETVAIRGNIDEGREAGGFPSTRRIHLQGRCIYVLHDLKELDFDPVAEKVDMVISGHSHKPLIREEAGVLYLNPGSAGPRRFKLPITVARVQIGGEEIKAEIRELLV